MILDEFGEFADATSLILSTGVNLVGDVIDLGTASPGPGVGVGDPMYCVISIDTAVLASGGASTAVFSLVSDAQAAIAVDGSATVHYVSSAISKTVLVAGYVVAAFALPLGAPVYERYLGILVTVATNAITTGKFNAFLTHDVAKYRAYADASN